MTLFWIIAAAMILAALFFVVLPLLGRSHNQGPDRRALNIAIYQERLAELEKQCSEDGMNEADFELNKAELERELLIDVGGETNRTGARSNRRFSIAAVVVLLPLLAVGLYRELGSPGMMILLSAQSAAQNTPSDKPVGSIDDMTTALAARLQQNPDNPNGWYMLGRSYMSMERYADAVKAFHEAYERGGDYAPLLVDYAEALAINNDGTLKGRPAELIAKAMELEPDNHKAMLMAGMAAYQIGDGMTALRHWHTLFRKFGPDSPSAKTVQEYMMDAVAILTPEQRKQYQEELKKQLETAQADTASATDTASVASRITVSVSLDPALATEAALDDTVFIFARAAQGPRMPLAIIRKQVRDLPLTVSLDDSQSMMQGMNLSSFPQVVVGARISRSGNAIPQAGDLEGLSEPLAPSPKSEVSIQINSRR